ncbi:MAG: hypothetical protein J6B92_12075 [Paraprevotella sp.]|nr:hypothetical protein [Paraprevotella sp.]MBP3472612.1 hypothetical protein [Paraprevotella sp.]
MTVFVILMLAAVVLAAVVTSSGKFNKNLFGSSTFMFFGDNNLNAGAAC